MPHQPDEPSDFKKRLRDSIYDERLKLTKLQFSKHENVYVIGDQAEMVYFIESGHIKLIMLSPDGKEGLLGIHTAGDTFGELCLAESSPRQEFTARHRHRRQKFLRDLLNDLKQVLEGPLDLPFLSTFYSWVTDLLGEEED